ncbi:unnamed protein product [Mytilus coruscus]|uniref:Ig-like domain-containing protein n=1 Tax=Mytilus coruscus TaxID=42192 RepID=A0A6J8B691_MYTCO|nr:unnamed protein product [Mytilus coruscus]
MANYGTKRKEDGESDCNSSFNCKKKQLSASLMNQEDLDAMGIFYDTEVTAVTDLLKMLKNRKSRTSFPEVAKYFIDLTDEHLKLSLDLDNIPSIDEESAPAIEERELVEYLEEDSRNLEKFRLMEMKKWDFEKDALKLVQVHKYYSLNKAKKFIELTQHMITQSILSRLEHHDPSTLKEVANEDVGENIFSDIFARFTEIFFLLPVTGRRTSVWMDDKIVGSINNTRYYEYIPRGAPNPVLLMFCEVKRVPVQESEDAATQSWISRKLPKTVLGQVGVELVTESFRSAFLPNVLGVICMRTEVIFVYLTIASDHVKTIRNNEEIGNPYSIESIDVYVPEGGTIELQCPFFSTSTPIIWQSTHGLLFDGREVDNSLRRQNKMAIVGNIIIGQFNLMIFNVSSADVGYYVCGTYSGNETHQTRFNVHLAAAISNLTIQTTNQGFLHGTTGVEMSIVCSARGGLPLRNLSMELEVDKEVVLNTSARHLYYTFIPDANMHLMNVTCRGYDILLEKSFKESITLNITYPPIVKLGATPSAVVREGSAVTLFCNHDSYPETKDVKWTKDEISYNKLNFRTKIVFQQTSREDAGSYKCTVCNEVGRTSVSLKLIVLYAPNVSVTILQNGSLLCNATGVPNDYRFSKWEHVSEFGEHIRYLDGLNDGNFNILSDGDSVTYLKNGKYICTVHNGISNRFHEVNQTGYIFLQFQGRPFCLNTSVRTMTKVDNEDMLNVKIAVDAVSIPIYNMFQWLHINQVIQTNLTRYTMASTETIIPTDIYGRLVLISAYRFTLAFTAFKQDNYGEYSMVISNKNGTSICSANEQWERSSVWKEYLYYGIIPVCFLAASGWIALLIYCRKRHQMHDTSNDRERQQNQQLQYATNYYDEINESELLNLSSVPNASIRSSFHFSDRSEISSRTTISNYDAPELSNSIYINPYQQLVGHLNTICHSYETLTRPHDYFVVIDCNISNSSNLKRHTY